MAQLYVTVTSCLGCPKKTVDANITRYVCSASQRTIGWMSEIEDAVEAGFFTAPSWCPLTAPSHGGSTAAPQGGTDKSPVRPVYSLDEV